MWTEHVTPETFDARVWPRTAAIAERLWSPAEVRDVADMYRRLDLLSIQLEAVGSTHLKNAGMMLRRLSGTSNIGSLQELVGYLEPLKGYRRNAADNFTKYAPYTQLVDVAVADPGTLRNFNAQLDSLLAAPTPARKAAMRSTLQRWQILGADVTRMAASNPSLTTAQGHASALASLASFLLTHTGWMDAGKRLSLPEQTAFQKLLQEAERPKGYCTLGVAESLSRHLPAGHR